MQTRRRQREQHIARRDRPPVNDLRAIDNPDDEARDVVLTFRIKPRHLSRLPAEQYTTILTTTIRDTLNHSRHHLRRQLPRRDVIEKEQRSRALHENVIHTVVHQIASDRVMHTRRKRDLQLRADAISGGHEHRLGHPRKRAVEHAAEAANLGQRALVERAARELLDAIGRARGCVDVDSSIAVGNGFRHSAVFFGLGGRGGGPKSPYAMNPERDESSFCAVRPAHASSVGCFAVVTAMSLAPPRVVSVISPCKSVRYNFTFAAFKRSSTVCDGWP